MVPVEICMNGIQSNHIPTCSKCVESEMFKKSSWCRI